MQCTWENTHMTTPVCTRLNSNNVSRIRTTNFLLPHWEGLLCFYLHVSASLRFFFLPIICVLLLCKWFEVLLQCLQLLISCSEQKARDAIYHSYHNHINGFAAVLEEEEAAEIARHPNVLSVFPDKGRKKHTTNSWGFLMLNNYEGRIQRDSLWKKANFSEDIIIANLDTGIFICISDSLVLVSIFVL